MLLNFVLHPSNLDGYIGLLLKFVAVAMVLWSTPQQLVARVTLHVILFLALASVPFYVLGLLQPGIIRSAIPLTTAWGGEYRITPLYVYGYYNFERNNGVFWEPGAFQAFLNLGIAIALLLPGLRHRGVAVSILLAVLATTFSTTGYILAPIWFACWALSTTSGRNASRVLLGASVTAAGIFVVSRTSVVLDKLQQTNSSFSRRSLDTASAFELMLQRPITGWGYQNNAILTREYGIPDTSNSLMAVGYQFGLLALLAMLVVVAIRLRSLGLNLPIVTLSLIAYVAATSTENLVFAPLFIGLLFVSSRSGERALEGPRR